MRLIDADLLEPDADYDDGEFWAYSKRQIDEAPTVQPNIEVLSNMQPAQPEIKPIEYRDCANAMLRMWMDNVVTDGEYNHIMDKLNAHWGMENG